MTLLQRYSEYHANAAKEVKNAVRALASYGKRHGVELDIAGAIFASRELSPDEQEDVVRYADRIIAARNAILTVQQFEAKYPA